MTKKKWMAYGITGLTGIGVLALTATAAAQAMELRTADGEVLPGGTITGRESGILSGPGVELVVRDGGVSVVSAPDPQTVGADAPVPAAPEPAPAPEQPAPAPQASVASAPSVQSAPSAASVVSAPSN